MFGRFGWAEILVIVVLILILFGHNKIPGMMKNLADGINIFKKELKGKKQPDVTEKKQTVKKNPVKKQVTKAVKSSKSQKKK